MNKYRFCDLRDLSNFVKSKRTLIRLRERFLYQLGVVLVFCFKYQNSYFTLPTSSAPSWSRWPTLTGPGRSPCPARPGSGSGSCSSWWCPRRSLSTWALWAARAAAVPATSLSPPCPRPASTASPTPSPTSASWCHSTLTSRSPTRLSDHNIRQ